MDLFFPLSPPLLLDVHGTLLKVSMIEGINASILNFNPGRSFNLKFRATPHTAARKNAPHGLMGLYLVTDLGCSSKGHFGKPFLRRRSLVRATWSCRYNSRSRKNTGSIKPKPESA